MKYVVITMFCLAGLSLAVTSCGDDESCTETTWYEDADNDGLGNPDVSLSACEQPSGYVSDNTDSNDSGEVSAGVATPMAAFDEFNSDAVTISFDGDEVTIESTGLPNHTSPYWSSGEFCT